MAACKLAVLRLFLWFNKKKEKNALPDEKLSCVPSIIRGLLPMNDHIVGDIYMVTAVWKKGILALFKSRGIELRGLQDRTRGTKDPFDLYGLVSSVMVSLSNNIHFALDQLAKELLRGEGLVRSHCPDGHKLVRFWSSNMISIARKTPEEFCRALVTSPMHIQAMLRLLDFIHPAFGARGSEAINAEAMRQYFYLNVTSCINTCLTHKDVPDDMKREVLGLFRPRAEGMEEACDAGLQSTPRKILPINRGQSYNIPRLIFLLSYWSNPTSSSKSARRLRNHR